jgi:hypothetical protein
MDSLSSPAAVPSPAGLAGSGNVPGRVGRVRPTMSRLARPRLNQCPPGYVRAM